MHDIGALAPHNGVASQQSAQAVDEPQTLAVGIEGNDSKALLSDGAAMFIDLGRNRHLEAGIPRCAGHGHEMRHEEPIFSDEIKYFGHRDLALYIACR